MRVGRRACRQEIEIEKLYIGHFYPYQLQDFMHFLLNKGYILYSLITLSKTTLRESNIGIKSNKSALKAIIFNNLSIPSHASVHSLALYI